MSTIEEMINQEAVSSDEIKTDRGAEFEKPKLNLNFGWIFEAKVPEKSIDEYAQHPLNFDNKKSTSRIIRGFEGLLGALDRAIIEIFIGVLEKVKEGKNGA